MVLVLPGARLKAPAGAVPDGWYRQLYVMGVTLARCPLANGVAKCSCIARWQLEHRREHHW